jgi:4-aminobutyrate aminotransferase-like enzyme/Ser/Thr protein kinase RdoA (MazF antagonist)
MSLLSHTPGFSESAVLELAHTLYGLRATASPLPSERDQNFLLQTDAGGKFVLKIANAKEERAMLEAQQQALAHLAQHTALCPRVVPTRSGAAISTIQAPNGAQHLVRLVTYLEGTSLGRVKRHSPELMRDLGRGLGEMDRALASFDHPALHRDFHWDLANGLRVVREHSALIKDEPLRALVEKIAADFEREIAPVLPHLRRSVIHNDANDYNVLVGDTSDNLVAQASLPASRSESLHDLYSRNQRVTGVIDFGDMVHSYTAGDLAIAIAYAILNNPDPLAVAAHLTQGYHAAYALTEDELAALWSLMKLRLCTSVCHAAQQQQQAPDNEYLSISQQAIRHTLPKLAQIPPRFAEARLRHACGLAPVKNSARVQAWLQAHPDSFASILENDLRTTPCLVFDLSINSALIHGDLKENAEPLLTQKLFGLMKSAGAKIGVGRYDEARLLYLAPAFATGESMTDERRTIHLGLDLFAQAGTAICAPLAGVVHAFANNAAAQDYGPVIILQHRTSEGVEFFTLYGHLSVESLRGLYLGKKISQGERFAAMGDASVNGGWTPHLHFQIILDLLDRACDFPGVGRASEREVWKSFSPDPNLILNLSASLFPKTEPTKEQTLAARRKLLGKNLSIAYHEPVKIVRGWMQYLFDETGRKYLDAYNNVPHVGHCHPRVIEAAREQMAKLNTNTRYLHDAINQLAERLCATLPEPLRVCYFVNSGSEANELALRLARAYTKQRGMIVLEAAYHGNTNTLIDLSPYKHLGPGGMGTPDWVHVAPLADGYRGAFKHDEERAGEKYAQHVADLIARVQRSGKGLAGFIAETCPSVGGQIIFPRNYLAEVYRHVRAGGGVCIADEVQTGYGRMGTHFYAFEAQRVTPDIVVLGKPIGNGHPLAAVITTHEIASAFDNGMEYFSTFGGSTVSCAIGAAVLDIVRQENLQAHALRVGERMLQGLRELQQRFALIGDVRGSGLFLGAELVRDRETLAPATEEAAFISNRMREHGVLLGTDGPFHNVIKIRPPMPFDENDADLLVATLAKILEEDFA